MNTVESWAAILAAVRDPFALAGLGLLVAMVVLRLSLSKVVALKGAAASRTVTYSISVVAALALLLASGAFGLRFYEIRAKHQEQRTPLTRVEVESFLQSNRGNIERCLAKLPKRYFYVDLVFSNGEDEGVNMEVLPGTEAEADLEFMHPSLREKEVESWSGHELLRQRNRADKLAVTAPEVNGCIVNTLKADLRRYSLHDRPNGFIHRYITDAGGGRQ